MKLKVFIVEDEICVRDEIKYLLGRYSTLEIVGEADNSFDAVRRILSLKPDVVFLDIKLGEAVDGITLAQTLQEMSPAIRIVFVTAFEDYAVRGFELNAVDYVLKPFNEARLAKTVERLLQNRPADNLPASAGRHGDRIIMKKNLGWKLVDIPDIYYFQSQDHVTLAVTETDTYTLNYTLRELELQMPATFLRTHKSFIVNVEFIHEIVPWFNYTYRITLKNNRGEIPVGRSYMKKFKSTLTFA